MRFPFRFMSLLSVAFGAWIVLYLRSHPPGDRLALGAAVAAAALSVGFGVYGLLRPADRSA